MKHVWDKTQKTTNPDNLDLYYRKGRKVRQLAVAERDARMKQQALQKSSQSVE